MYILVVRGGHNVHIQGTGMSIFRYHLVKPVRAFSTEPPCTKLNIIHLTSTFCTSFDCIFEP